MKTKSRFIVILAALSLLIAMLPIGPAGAATGTVALDETFYSDKATFNIVTVSVNDSDISSGRTGTASILLSGAAAGNTNSFKLNGDAQAGQFAGAVLAGEADKTDKHDGGGPVLFVLSKTPRDADEDGVLEDADVEVVVSGVTIATADYTVDFAGSSVTFADAPALGTDNVVFNYETSEYDQTTPANTPVRLFGSTVKFGATVATATSEISISVIDNATGTVTITSDIDGTNANTDSVVVSFVYDVQDTDSDTVTLSSNTSIAAGKNREVDGVETTASSGIFESQVALFTAATLATIESESADSANDLVANTGDGDGDVQVDELDNTDALGAALQIRVEAASVALGLPVATTEASDFLLQVLPVADGDTLTATYVDSSPSATVTKTATVDLAAPTVTLVTPTDKLFTNDTLVSLIADVVDPGVGVATGSIALVPPAGVAGTTIQQPVLDGFKVSFVPNAAISEGAKTWFIAVKDKVGNEPTEDDAATVDTNEGTRGAAPHGSATADNPFAFTVDTAAPAVSSATTGRYLKNPGVTTGTGLEEEKTDKRTWVRLVFSLGTGTASIDDDSVATSDFKVAGVEPLSVIVNAKAQGGIAAGSAVYLEVAEQDTDAKPKVELVGEVLDTAGNAATSGTITAAADELTPVLTVTTSAALDKDDVTVTVTSSEALVINPQISTTTTEPAAGVVAGDAALTVTSTGTKSWTAKFSNGTGGSSEQWIVVTGTDVQSNSSIVGDDSPTDDQFSFEVDDADPTVSFVDAGGLGLGATDQEEGAIWIVAVFDEDEYTGDSYKKVTVTAMSLEDEDGVVINSDITDLFSSDNISYTLAVDLAPGDDYNFEITAEDSAGNEVTDDVDFDVVKRTAFSLDLKPGVNLVSIPGTPVGDGGNLNTMLEDLPVTAVVTYSRALDLAGENPWLTSTLDAETGLFTGDISVLEPGKAYFITATASTTGKVLIEQPAMVLPPTIAVRQGFNAIGFWAISGAASADIDEYLNSVSWTVAYTFDPTPGVGWTVIRPDNPAVLDVEAAEGKGYLVFVSEDGTLTP